MLSTKGPISLVKHDLTFLVKYDLTALWVGGRGGGGVHDYTPIEFNMADFTFFR